MIIVIYPRREENREIYRVVFLHLTGMNLAQKNRFFASA